MFVLMTSGSIKCVRHHHHQLFYSFHALALLILYYFTNKQNNFKFMIIFKYCSFLHVPMLFLL